MFYFLLDIVLYNGRYEPAKMDVYFKSITSLAHDSTSNTESSKNNNGNNCTKIVYKYACIWKQEQANELSKLSATCCIAH